MREGSGIGLVSAPVKQDTPPAPSSLRRRATAVVDFLGAQARNAARSPVTLVLVLAPWVVGAFTGSLVGGPGEDLLDDVAAGVPTLSDGKVWTLLTAAFFSMDLATYIVTSVLLLIVGTVVERRVGSARMALVALASQVVGTALGVGVVAIAGLIPGWMWAELLASSVAVGATPLVAGLLVALSVELSSLWRRRIRVGVVAVCVVMLLYGGQVQDVLRLSCAFVGFVAGLVILRRHDHDLTPHRSSRRETRVLVALVVASTALGPLLIAFAEPPLGPLSVLADLYVAPGVIYDEGDRNLVETFDALVPALLVLVLAAGLRRGRRFAWWATVALHVVLGVVGAFYGIDYYQWAVDNDLANLGFSWIAYLVPLIILPVAILALLWVTRRSFVVEAPPGTYRSLGLTVAAALIVLWVVYVLVAGAIADQFAPEHTMLQLVVDFPLRLLPNGYLYLVEPPTPESGLAFFLVDWLPLLFWLIVLVGLLRSFVRARVTSARDDAVRARAILERHGTTALAYLTTWEGNSYWFTADAESFVAYRVEGGVAITTGDPVGPRDKLAATVDEFIEFCRVQSWTPCFYSTTEAVKDATDRLGWASLQVAEETVLPLGSLAFTGKKFQDIRSSISRAAKSGVHAEWLSYPDAPLAVRDQIQAISEEWVSDKALPEMGFTLGGLDELDDKAVRCLIAVDTDRTIHGVTSWMPCYRDGVPVGWTLDFMRRRSEGFKGVMEFLIGTAALDVQKEGAEFLSLSGAPLAQANPGEEETGVQKLLETVGKTMEPVYGFRSLLRFKAKFQPVYQPMYMCYPEAAVLPRIGLGISHAYLPHLTFRQAVRMMGQLT